MSALLQSASSVSEFSGGEIRCFLSGDGLCHLSQGAGSSGRGCPNQGHRRHGVRFGESPDNGVDDASMGLGTAQAVALASSLHQEILRRLSPPSEVACIARRGSRKLNWPCWGPMLLLPSGPIVGTGFWGLSVEQGEQAPRGVVSFRGPDESARTWFPPCSLGYRRLFFGFIRSGLPCVESHPRDGRRGYTAHSQVCPFWATSH